MPTVKSPEINRFEELEAPLNEYSHWARDSYVRADTPDYENMTEAEVLDLLLDGRLVYFLQGILEELEEVLEKVDNEVSRAVVIGHLASKDVDEVSAIYGPEIIERIKKEFGDVMWYLASAVEYYAHSIRVPNLGTLVVDQWSRTNNGGELTENELNLHVIAQDHQLGNYLRAHASLRTASEGKCLRIQSIQY